MASAVLYTSNGIFIHQLMTVISSSSINIPLNLERKVNLVVLNVSHSEPLMPFATVAGLAVQLLYWQHMQAAMWAGKGN